MPRSQIIKDFINEKMSVNVALNNLFVISYELKNEELNMWIKRELNGYEKEDILPDYRKQLPSRILYTGINGHFQMTNQPLAIKAFGDYAKLIDSMSSVSNSITELMKDSGKMQKDLTMFAGEIEKNTGIQCISIALEFGNNIREIIITNVRTRIIEALLLLEKEFGLLDNLYIENIQNSGKITEINKSLKSIVYANGKEL